MQKSINPTIEIILRWGPAFILMLVIFGLSATPASQLPDAGIFDLLLKKGGHLTGYALLGLSYLRGMQSQKRKALWLAFGLVFLYALSDEIHQAFVSGRHASPVDIGIDLIGASIGMYFFSISQRLRRLVLSLWQPVR
jgi:VanZ family protein